jgi:hypothetical protein
VWELPADTWKRFLADGDGEALLAQIRVLPTRSLQSDVSYPEHHRLCDVELGGQAYRVSRLVDLNDGREQLFIKSISTPSYDQLGVPYWLHGSALARWVREESECPTKDEIDWESYQSR